MKIDVSLTKNEAIHGTLEFLLSSLVIVLSTAVLFSLQQCETFGRPQKSVNSIFFASAVLYYTNETCWTIHDHQNCTKHGRPDTNYLKWRWKPDNGQLPIFDPQQFPEIVLGKSMAHC
ncbi:hypothetical protein MLD38_024546 [Melastoma candidum]|uniref:Uncharacterized protein n=1 Tax=Melastoma candidum TaxID=119954 RepID=A0ACB9NSB7_9MYRT|nr:hypothetical protein MLD38_024546 [Melastoma candidum]